MSVGDQEVLRSFVEAVTQLQVASFESTDTMPAVGVVLEDLEDGITANIRISGLIGGINTTSTEINQDVFIGASGSLIFEDPLTEGDSNIISQKKRSSESML